MLADMGQNRIRNLDGLRCVAILLVIVGHLRYSLAPLNEPGGILLLIASFGSMGVDIFFAISGFLITNRLLNEFNRNGSISLKAFYLRRIFRLFPALLVFLLFLAGLSGVGVIGVSQGELFASALFYRNFYTGPSGWFTAHFWSLAVEEHYYLIFPALLLFCAKRKWNLRWFLCISCLLLIVWQVLDQRVWNSLGFLGLDSHTRSDYRMVSLFAGALVGARWTLDNGLNYRSKKIEMVILVSLSLAFISFLKAHLGLEEIWRPFILAEIVALVVDLGDVALVSWLEWVPIAWIGRISYSLYLWQQLFLVPYELRSDLQWTDFPVNLALVFVMAAISYYVIEKPFIKVGHRIASR
jgi:peptidoglycan/LPS O-acetylase OafA/YrhL